MVNIGEFSNGKPVEVTGMITSELLKNKELAETLKQALSLDVKDATPEERQARIVRRNLICKTLGISTKNIDKFLKDLDNHIIKSESDDKNKKKAGKVLLSAISLTSNFIPALKVVEIFINGVKFIIDVTNLIKDFSDQDSAKIEALKILMQKVDNLNTFIDKKLKENPEILNNPNDRKKLIEELKKELKASGVEIKTIDIPAEKEA